MKEHFVDIQQIIHEKDALEKEIAKLKQSMELLEKRESKYESGLVHYVKVRTLIDKILEGKSAISAEEVEKNVQFDDPELMFFQCRKYVKMSIDRFTFEEEHYRKYKSYTEVPIK